MRLVERAGRRYVQFERLAAEPGLVHAFSTRPQDVSMRTDDRAANRDAARRRMADDLGIDPARLACCAQVHQPNLCVIRDAGQVGRLEDTDAVVTNVPGVGLMTFSADCPLILAYDPTRRALGLAHASWRCTIARFAESLMDSLRSEFGCEPGDLRCGVGPSAGPHRYEVREDVYHAAAALEERDEIITRRDGRLYFNLWEANRRQLVRAGVPESQIEIGGICTMTRTDLLYSYRREGAGCGHFGLLAALVDQ